MSKSESIVKVGKLVYARLFDEQGYSTNQEDISVVTANGTQIEANKLVWRFYWTIN